MGQIAITQSDAIDGLRVAYSEGLYDVHTSTLVEAGWPFLGFRVWLAKRRVYRQYQKLKRQGTKTDPLREYIDTYEYPPVAATIMG